MFALIGLAIAMVVTCGSVISLAWANRRLHKIISLQKEALIHSTEALHNLDASYKTLVAVLNETIATYRSVYDPEAIQAVRPETLN